MGKHVAGGGRRVASARSLPDGRVQVRGITNVSNRIDEALQELGFSRQVLRDDLDTTFRVGDNGTVTVTGTRNGSMRMARVLGNIGGQRFGSIGNQTPDIFETRWRIME